MKLRYRYSSYYSSSPRPALRTGWIRPAQHRFRDYQCIGDRQRDSDLAPLRLLLAEVKASEIRLGIKSYFNQSGTGTGLNPPPEVRNAPGGRIREGPENRGGSPLEVRNVLTAFW